MSKITDGGPAFPMGYHRDGNSADHAGMSLRAYFAGQALGPAMTLCVEAVKSGTPKNDLTERDIAGVATAIADALIAKLSEP